MRALLVAIVALSSTSVFAQAPDSLGFQGYLTDSFGNPVDSTDVSITFKLYKGATEVWAETQSVDVENGLYDVMLGSVTSLDTVAFNRSIELGITIGGDPEMSPRTPLVSGAFARALPGLYTFYREDFDTRGYNVVGGASNNTVGAGVIGATIGGGGGVVGGSAYPNSVAALLGTIGGGGKNEASGIMSTVGGGYYNRAEDRSSAIGGGSGNIARGRNATIAGGLNNRALELNATVGGGSENWAQGQSSTVGGGYGNMADGNLATIPGGAANSATQGYTFAAGFRAQALHSGSFVWADSFRVAGLEFPTTGVNQFIVRAGGGVGLGTNSPNNQLTVSGDADVTGKVGIGTISPTTALSIDGGDDALSGPSIVLSGTASDQRESGRIRFVEDIATNRFGSGMFIHYRGDQDKLHIGYHAGNNFANGNGEIYALTVHRPTLNVGIQQAYPGHPLHIGTDSTNGNGAHVTAAGAWTNGSSRHLKTGFEGVDKGELLKTLASLPITRWSYNGEQGVDHIGPVAEDFRDAFQLGHDERYITTVDADGVALAAIQGLYELVMEQQAEIERMRAVMTRAGLD